MSPPELARFYLPGPQMGGCIFAGIERDTRGAALDEAARFNYYPATPMALISWIFEGELHMVSCPPGGVGTPRLGPPLPRLLLCGPQRQPSASWSPGPVHALSVAFYPEALAQLIGQPVGAFVDRILPAASVLESGLLAACEAVFAAQQPAVPFREVEARLHTFWLGAHSRSPAPLLGDWVRSLATRAAFSKTGCSARQLQRRIKSWAGQSYRDLQIFARVEEAFTRSAPHPDRPGENLAGLAAGAGFADQSHMGREVRRVTGIAPGRFRHLVDTEESFWFYRLIEGQLPRS